MQMIRMADQLFAEWDSPNSPGCALGVIRDGQFVYKRGYRMANLEHNIPISSDTVFRIGSTSKQFTAMCVVLLAERGKLSLDDDIGEYLPEMPEYERTITIRHLIHHTSGLRDYLELMTLAGTRDDDFYTDDQVVEMLTRQRELNFAPGDEYLYSNTGYYLLGVIVKRASGRSLREFAEENIFKPLGMTHTHFHDDHTKIVRNRADGYSPQHGGGYRIDMITLDMVGDGGVFTTVEDLFLWDQNFYHNKLGREKDNLISQVLTPGTLNSGERQDYAFGLVVSDYKGVKMVSHGGGFAGFRAEMIRFPDQAFSVICLANLSTINPSRLARQVAEIYLGDQFEMDEKDAIEARFIELSTAVLENKIGVYKSATTGMIVEISIQDGKLFAEMFGESIPISPVTEMDFATVNAPYDAKIKFERLEQDGPWLMHACIEDDKPDTLQAIEIIFPSAVQLAEYVGDYTSDELQVTYAIVLADGKLYVRYRGAPQDPLKPVTTDMFRVGYVTLLFARDAEGRVSGFRVNVGRVRNIYFVRTNK